MSYYTIKALDNRELVSEYDGNELSSREDVEGKKEATSLKFDADEARYMANRFDYRVRQREADEPYMDDFNKSNFEQVIDEKKSPEAINRPANFPYQKAAAEEKAEEKK